MDDALKRFTPSDGFIGRYTELVRDFVIPYQYDMLSDAVEGAEKSHAPSKLPCRRDGQRNRPLRRTVLRHGVSGQRRGQVAGGGRLLAFK